MRMVNERNDQDNKAPSRGSKLRSQGSNPTGSQKMSFTPEYSEEKDYDNMTHLNSKARAKMDQHSEGWGELDPCCKELGLNLKKPLI